MPDPNRQPRSESTEFPLAHCFACQKNFNNIDLLRTLGHDFPSAVALLERWLKQYQAQRPRYTSPT